MLQVFLLGAVLGLFSTGCRDALRQGAAGESCTAASDCQAELSCIAQRCVSTADAGLLPSVGIRCSARSECQPGLSCLDDVCRAMTVGTSDPSARFSGRGESCRVKNDCAVGLACVMQTCRQLDIPLSHTQKSCFRVECASQADCCAAFVPDPKCATYQDNCKTDPIFCNTYRTLCECSKDCVDQLCVDKPPGCQTNAECTSMQTPFCSGGKCGECDTDAACTGAGQRCVTGMCLAACTLDENCPGLSACTDGKCVPAGCTSDRQCAFAVRSPLAVCRSGKCQTPCAADSDCLPSMQSSPTQSNQPVDPKLSLQVCEAGQCVFVGCETDSECRALLGLANSSGDARAVCK